jgi:class 3 adenylate cyclase/tetratricopeptide (TPR) repeat protein
MELAESVDPEEWHHILDRFFMLLAEGVHRFEGTINQYTGDGIMALFGAPIAHEDHSRRACYAALYLTERLREYSRELRRERGLDFAVRMGINSGEVIVGKIGDDLRMDYTAQGHTVGLAARIEELAEAGKVYVSERTASLVAGFFQLEDLGQFKLRGSGEAVHAYSLEGPGPMRTRLDLSRARGFSRFVGRAEEMQDLEAALRRAVAGQGQVVGVVGEIGLGKSRLCEEFIEHCRQSGVRVDEGHSVPHGRNVPFLPIVELLGSYFGVSERDRPDEARRKIAGTLILADRSLEEALPLVFDLMGVPDPERPAPPRDPETRQRQLFGAMRQLLQSRSSREPQLLVLEDLHWIDEGTASFLELMVDSVVGSRILLLVNFRPEFHAGWMQKSYYHQIPLLPLRSDEIGQLLHDLLGDDPSVVGLPERIRDRTAGNPFFIEELVRSLAESGILEGEKGAHKLVQPVEEIEIPESVQTVIAARIDRLNPRDKGVLDAAAVVGKTFSERLLSYVVDLPESELVDALRTLVDAEFISERAVYPEAEYLFKHPLTQEVAYGSQLGDHRARVHRVAAQAIEELNRDALEGQSGVLAHHWERAGDPWRAAEWNDRAANRLALTHPGEATRHWMKVRSLLDRVPASDEAGRLRVASCTQILNLGWHLGLTDEEVGQIFDEGRALAEQSDDLRSLAGLYRAYALSTLLAGSIDDSAKWFEEAVRLADRADDERMKAALRTSLILSHLWGGRLRQALTEVQQLMDQCAGDIWLGSEILGYSPFLWSSFMKGSVLIRTRRLDDAEQVLAQTLEQARRHGDTFVLGHTYHAQSLLGWFRGDPDESRARAYDAIEVFERMGSTNQAAYGHLRLGAAQALGREWKAAQESLEHALAIAHRHRLNVSEAEILAYLAQAYRGVGEQERALETAEESVAAARRRGTRLYLCDALLSLGRILLRTEGGEARERIQSILGELDKLVAQIGAVSYAPFVHAERAELARRTGDRPVEQAELREAHRLFTEMGATGYAEQLRPS